MLFWEKITMRLLYLLCISFAALFLFGCHQSVLTDQDGHVVDLIHHPKQWLMIHYWAPWCPACKQELPEINQFYLLEHDRVLVYGVDYDMPGAAQLKLLVKKMGIDFPQLTEDPAPILQIANLQGLPMTFIYNPEGQLVHTFFGPQTLALFESTLR